MSPTQLKRLRAKLKLSQRELAERLGVTGAAIAQWELGINPIPAIAEVALAKIKDDIEREKEDA